jgi:hypothetical protein
VPNPGVFSVAGDIPPSAFLGDLGDGTADFADLANAAELNDLVFYYISTPLPVGGNSFQSGGALSTNSNWTTNDLLNPSNADPSWCPGGLSPLECEIEVNHPAVIFLFVGRNDVLYGVPVDQFRSELDTAIQIIMKRGVIPVLATLPGDPASYPGLAEYNSALIKLADHYHLPLLNVARLAASTSVPSVNPDLTLTSPGTGDVFGEAERSTYGVPLRNVVSLTLLQALRVNVPIP